MKDTPSRSEQLVLLLFVNFNYYRNNKENKIW